MPWREVKRLGELQKRLGVSLDEMMTMVGAVLHSEPYSKTEVCELLGSTPEELAETSLSPNTLHGKFINGEHLYSKRYCQCASV